MRYLAIENIPRDTVVFLKRKTMTYYGLEMTIVVFLMKK
jgi:hypothetical protein